VNINIEVFLKMALGVAEAWKRDAHILSDIDSKFGDGDHGVTMNKLAGIIEKNVENSENKSVKEFIENLSSDIMLTSGGSACPLYGTLFEGLAAPLKDDSEITPDVLARMFADSLDALRDLTKAKIGDKTMMDAIIPAIEAAQKAPRDFISILKSASEAADAGAEATKKMVSKFGRAKIYGEKTLGTKDAGAVSSALFFEGLYKGAVESNVL
jgi:dihydroxyacetone kinase-like protein